jgi:hypothetical protein
MKKVIVVHMFAEREDDQDVTMDDLLRLSDAIVDLGEGLGLLIGSSGWLADEDEKEE